MEVQQLEAQLSESQVLQSKDAPAISVRVHHRHHDVPAHHRHYDDSVMNH